MIWPVLNKISLELIKALVIAPVWPKSHNHGSKIVRTSSDATNGYRKQIFATFRHKSKTSFLCQTDTARSDVLSRSAQTSTIQK